MRAKCGRVVTWHWAHAAGADCDSWAEPDTVWHRDWQARFPLDRTEVVMGCHRADAVTIDGRVVEFQHSALSVGEIEARERHYGPDMIWVFDGSAAYAADRFLIKRPQRGRGGASYRTFRWKQARKSLRACRARLFLDLGDGSVFDIRRIYADEAPVGGWGQRYTTDSFVGSLTHSDESEAAV